MTLKEVALQAGVAPSTVSLVLNNKPGVHRQTRERVVALLQQNGFSLRNNPERFENGEIKLIRYQSVNHMQERNEDFFVGILNGAEQKARLAGYNLSVTNASYTEFPAMLHQMAANRSVAGVILLGSELRVAEADLLARFSLPLVSVDNRFNNLPVNSISIGNIEGAFHAVAYLFRLGHRKIGFLRGAFDIGGIQEREIGYYQAMKTLGLEVNPAHVIDIDLLFDTATAQMHQYLARNPNLPTAFFAANDIVAAGCERALQQAGRRVPDDVSIVGFDDGTMSTFVDPPLTTMRVDRTRLGELAVSRLLDMIGGRRDEILKTELGVTLVKRRSTAPL